MTTEVTDTGSAYEITQDGTHVGLAAYTLHDGVATFTHTEVDTAFEGQGLGSVLVREALEDVRRRGLRVRPLCSFVRAWVDRHPDFQDLVDG